MQWRSKVFLTKPDRKINSSGDCFARTDCKRNDVIHCPAKCELRDKEIFPTLTRSLNIPPTQENRRQKGVRKYNLVR